MIAAHNLHWQTLLARLTERKQAIILFGLEDRTVSDVAVVFQVSRSAMP